MDHSNRPDQNNRSERVIRSAVGGTRDIINPIGKLDPNYNYRVVNDEGTRIDELYSYGYDPAPDKDIKLGNSNPEQTGSNHTAIVDKRTGKKGVLMRQPIELHEKDRQLRKEKIDKSEESMFRKLKTDDGRYGGVERSNSLARKTGE